MTIFHKNIFLIRVVRNSLILQLVIKLATLSEVISNIITISLLPSIKKHKNIIKTFMFVRTIVK